MPDAVCAVLTPDDGRKNHLKQECLTGTNKLRKVVSCWLYCQNILAMHGHMNVKPSDQFISTNGVSNVQYSFYYHSLQNLPY